LPRKIPLKILAFPIDISSPLLEWIDAAFQKIARDDNLKNDFIKNYFSEPRRLCRKKGYPACFTVALIDTAGAVFIKRSYTGAIQSQPAWVPT